MFSTVFVVKWHGENAIPGLLRLALARCKATGLTTFLPGALPDIIFGKYESLGRSTPWDRHTTTAILKQICVTLGVRTFCGIVFLSTELIFIQESGFPGFCESDIDIKLQTFWDTFTWEFLKSYPSTPPGLTVLYVKLV